MRISDWSSDVCSSDLNAHAPCTPVLPITLSFSAPISRADAEKIRLKTVEGERSPSIGDDDSQSDEAGSLTSVTFDAPFPPDADVTIALPPELKDDSGRTLGNAGSFPLATHMAPYPPLVKFAKSPLDRQSTRL